MSNNKTPVNTDFAKDNRLQNSPYFCVFKYARAVKQRVWNEAENRERDWGETLKNTRFARVKLLRHALPISLLILRKKTDFFAVYKDNKLRPWYMVIKKLLLQIRNITLNSYSAFMELNRLTTRSLILGRWGIPFPAVSPSMYCSVFDRCFRNDPPQFLGHLSMSEFGEIMFTDKAPFLSLVGETAVTTSC